MACPSARLPPVSDAIKSQVLAGKTMSDADMDTVTAGGQPGTLGAGLTTAWYASDWKAAGSPHLMRASFVQPGYGRNPRPDNFKRNETKGCPFGRPFCFSSGVRYSRPNSAPRKSPKLSIKLCR
jgi:hypothetical protein